MSAPQPASRGCVPSGPLNSVDALRATFEAGGADLRSPIAYTCGSGACAAILVHAWHQIGMVDVPIFDASWMERGTVRWNEICYDVT